jgi:multiple sugar transport system permease protein
MAWLFYLVLIFFAMVYLFPFILQIGTSFKSDAEPARTH